MDSMHFTACVWIYRTIHAMELKSRGYSQEHALGMAGGALLVALPKWVRVPSLWQTYWEHSVLLQSMQETAHGGVIH